MHPEIEPQRRTMKLTRRILKERRAACVLWWPRVQQEEQNEEALATVDCAIPVRSLVGNVGRLRGHSKRD